MATWPATLPQHPLLSGYQRKRQPQVVRTDMDAGPVFVRRRFTASSTYFLESMLVDKTQRQTFWDFFDNTLAGGSLSFDWADPVTNASGSFRFREDPQESAEFGELFNLSMSLELLP